MKRLIVIAAALAWAGAAYAQAPSFDEANRNLREVRHDQEARMRDFLDYRQRRAEADQRELDADYARRQMNVIIQELQTPY